MFDPVEFGKAVGETVRDAVAKATEPLLLRIDDLEKQIQQQPAPKDGIDGKDAPAVTIEQIQESISADRLKQLVEDWLVANPPKDGIDGIDGKDGVAKDGVDGKSVTPEDIEAAVQKRVDGWALDFERRAQGVLERAIERMPAAKDGVDGKDGFNGLGFDDLSVEHDGERGIILRFVRGDQSKEFTLTVPMVIYRGVFTAKDHEPGDMVTWGGSLWHCDEPTSDKPGEAGSKGWTLAAKRGRDGKDGTNGRDLTKGVPAK